MYKLITFDITGTILKLKHPVGQIYSEVAKSFGINCNPAEVTAKFKTVWVDMNKEFPNYGLETGLGWQNWWKQVVIKTLDGFHEKSPSSCNSVEKAAEKLIHSFGSDEGWVINEGAHDLLTYLKGKDIFVGAISNFDPRLHDILKFFPATDVFKFVITSYEAKFLKPNPRIFLLAEDIYCKHIGTSLDKSSAIHIGDNFLIDAAGALNAGWNYAIIDTKKSSDTPKYNVYKSLLEFKEYLKTC